MYYYCKTHRTNMKPTAVPTCQLPRKTCSKLDAHGDARKKPACTVFLHDNKNTDSIPKVIMKAKTPAHTLLTMFTVACKNA